MALKNLSDIEKRLVGLVASLGGQLWADMLAAWKPPQSLPEAEELLDLTFRDAKALAGYIPDIRKICQNKTQKDWPQEELDALLAIYGYLNLATRLLMQINLLPQYNDHEDLIETLAGYRFSINELKSYLNFKI